MKAINELIALGFNLSIDNGKVKIDYKGSNPFAPEKVKPLLDEVKCNKEKAIKYIQTLIIYEIPDGINFDFQVQACIGAAHDGDIEWLRTDVYKKSRKVVFVGAIKKPELINMWKEAEKESQYYIDCPWKN